MGAGGREYQRARWATVIDQRDQKRFSLKLVGAEQGLAIHRHQGGQQPDPIHRQAIEKLVICL